MTPTTMTRVSLVSTGVTRTPTQGSVDAPGVVEVEEEGGVVVVEGDPEEDPVEGGWVYVVHHEELGKRSRSRKEPFV